MISRQKIATAVINKLERISSRQPIQLTDHLVTDLKLSEPKMRSLAPWVARIFCQEVDERDMYSKLTTVDSVVQFIEAFFDKPPEQ